MRTKNSIFITIAMLFITISIDGQEAIERNIKLRIDSIQKLMDGELLKIDKLKNELRVAKTDLDSFNMHKMAGETYVCIMGTNVIKNSQGYDFICSIRTGDRVKVVDSENGRYKIFFNGIYGFVSREAIEKEDVFIANTNVRIKKQEEEKAKIAEENAKKLAEEQRLEKEAQKEAQELLPNLIKKYGKVNGKKIYEGKVWIGATKAMVIDSWGKPKDINRSVGSWGVHEQWVYSNGNYLYIENGILTSWQD